MTSGSGKNQVEYDIEEEVETETEENQVAHEYDAETEEEQGEKNNNHEVEDLQSTLGMASHIKSKHKLIKEKEKKQLTICETINNSEAIIYNKNSFKKFFIRWIVKDDLSFMCVESEDFCNMIYLLRKDAFIPSAVTVKNYIMTFYEDSHKKIALILQNTSSKISFTIDAWTLSNNYSFLGITAHWVTESWELKSILLDFIKLEGPHSRANIKEAFLKSLKNFEIESKILGVTTDNASNNVTFLKAVEDDLSQKYIYFNSDDKHVRCLAHVINLAAQQTLTTLKTIENDETSNEEVGSLIRKLRTFVKKIKALPQQENKFKTQCKTANVPNLNVMLDVRTRWNSTYDMLVSELYKTLYVPQETQNTNIEYNSSDEDLVSHISKWHRIESVSEFDRYLKAARAQALCNILNWWKRHEEEYPNLSNMARDYLGIPDY
ncbi:zinc finger BED domain-containing protein RICESLEEPER 2-like [Rhizophagus clarus]|uniref:Zinc finger BED domain-containing protein RICESLEEPER 2-like n=1 Tax=Rhizophagus clarus TaxID=94130 RepID=A0A8H3KVQ1_9GLOM|nr:zinc finger BED domain-containing protein RICESLEEPER 2-like [Rhizophagus clarus]